MDRNHLAVQNLGTKAKHLRRFERSWIQVSREAKEVASSFHSRKRIIKWRANGRTIKEVDIKLSTFDSTSFNIEAETKRIYYISKLRSSSSNSLSFESRLRMASFNYFGCIIMLVMLMFVVSEARPLDPLLERKSVTKAHHRPLFESWSKTTKVGLAEEDAVSHPDHDSKRQSPGGPDPYHHSKNLS
ncbi:hypothetical protein CJ030_MR5G023956 [Morella rubra]|uniref:Uncharacterized protein n=1 Tax=Morella rubra TaxID=262757 RepID=A0A6A1VI35_9ROSI|nr:hypothetical protein CJ030_MR5G023956 [Morella rubra]